MLVKRGVVGVVVGVAVGVAVGVGVVVAVAVAVAVVVVVGVGVGVAVVVVVGVAVVVGVGVVERGGCREPVLVTRGAVVVVVAVAVAVGVGVVVAVGVVVVVAVGESEEAALNQSYLGIPTHVAVCRECAGRGLDPAQASRNTIGCVECGGVGFHGINPFDPTDALPGSAYRVAVYAARYRRGCFPLINPLDARADQRPDLVLLDDLQTGVSDAEFDDDID